MSWKRIKKWINCFLRVIYHKRFSFKNYFILGISFRVSKVFFFFFFSLDILSNKYKLLNEWRHVIHSTYILRFLCLFYEQCFSKTSLRNLTCRYAIYHSKYFAFLRSLIYSFPTNEFTNTHTWGENSNIRRDLWKKWGELQYAWYSFYLYYIKVWYLKICQFVNKYVNCAKIYRFSLMVKHN